MFELRAYDLHSLYGELLEPFRNPEFGPTLATLLLFLAVVVLIGFFCFAVPQAIRLRSALAAIKGGTDKENERQKRATFLRDYEKINKALSSNKTTSTVWQEFRKSLMFRGSPQLSTPQQKCIGWPEQEYISDAGEKAPELGAFVRHQTWAGLSAGVSELARRERLLL